MCSRRSGNKTEMTLHPRNVFCCLSFCLKFCQRSFTRRRFRHSKVIISSKFKSKKMLKIAGSCPEVLGSLEETFSNQCKSFFNVMCVFRIASSLDAVFHINQLCGALELCRALVIKGNGTTMFLSFIGQTKLSNFK